MQINKNKDKLLIAGFSSSLFFSIAYPIVHTVTVSAITSNLLSVASLLNCVLTVLITKIWLSKGKVLYRAFSFFLSIEVILYGILIYLFIIDGISPLFFFMSDAVLSSLITRNIICAGVRLKSLRYEGEDREKFDNKTVYYNNIACIIGYAFSSLIVLPTKLGFFLMFIGIAIDNIFYYYVYKKEVGKWQY